MLRFHSPVFKAFGVAAVVLAFSSAAQARERGHREFGAVGFGFGVSGDNHSEDGASGQVSAGFNTRIFGDLEEYSSTQDSDFTGHFNFDTDYNVIGINRGDKLTTSIKIQMDTGIHGNLSVDDERCGIYVAGSLQGNMEAWVNQPGSNGGQVQLTPETGLVCRIGDDVLMMISPTVGPYYAQADAPVIDGSRRMGVRADGIRAGLVARFIKGNQISATVRAGTSMSRFSDPTLPSSEEGVGYSGAGHLSGADFKSVSVDFNYKLTDNWMISFFGQYMQFVSPSEWKSEVKDSSRLQGGVRLIRNLGGRNW